MNQDASAGAVLLDVNRLVAGGWAASRAVCTAPRKAAVAVVGSLEASTSLSCC